MRIYELLNDGTLPHRPGWGRRRLLRRIRIRIREWWNRLWHQDAFWSPKPPIIRHRPNDFNLRRGVLRVGSLTPGVGNVALPAVVRPFYHEALWAELPATFDEENFDALMDELYIVLAQLDAESEDCITRSNAMADVGAYLMSVGAPQQLIETVAIQANVLAAGRR